MKFRNIFAVMAAIVGLAACDQNEKITEPEELTLDVSSVELAADGSQTATVMLKSNMAWELQGYTSDVQAWLSINPPKGEASSSAQLIQIKAMPNSGTVRSAEIKFYGNILHKETLLITQLGSIESGDGSLEKPYSVAEALEFISSLPADSNSDWLYVKGIVCEVDASSFSEDFGNITYYISDKGDNDAKTRLYVYRGLGLGGAKFKTANDVKAGDELILYTQVVNYKGTTPETVQNKSKIYSLNGTTAEVEVPVGGQNLTDGTYMMKFTHESSVFTCTSLGKSAKSGRFTVEAYDAAAEVKAEHILKFQYVSDKNCYTITDCYGRYLSWSSSNSSYFTIVEAADDASYWDVQSKGNGVYSVRNTFSDRYILYNHNKGGTAYVGVYMGGGTDYVDPELIAHAAVEPDPEVPSTSTTVAALKTLATEKYEAGKTSNLSLGNSRIENATVVAVPTTATALVSDETGTIYVYKSGHGLVKGDVVTLDGDVVLYGGTVLEYNSPDIEKKSSAAAVSHPSAEEWTSAGLSAYVAAAPYFVKYIAVSGIAAKSGNYMSIKLNDAEYYFSTYGENLESFEGSAVKAKGYVYNVNTTGKYVSMFVTEIEKDASADVLSLNPTSVSWEAAETDAKTVSVTTNAASWTASCEADWLDVKQEGDKLILTPKSANESSEADRTASVTVVAGSQTATLAAIQKKAADPNVKTCEFDFSALGYENSKEVTTVEKDGVTLSFSKGGSSTTPKYYTTGAAVRLYAKNTMKVESAKAISKIEFTFGSGDSSSIEITADCGSFTSPEWTGSSNAVLFTVGGTSGHRRIAKLVVTFAE